VALYEVHIYERIVHSIEIEAEDGKQAKEKAYDLISNVPEDSLRLKYEYSVEGEYLGVDEVIEIG
jgi:hypothetical protein